MKLKEISLTIVMHLFVYSPKLSLALLVDFVVPVANREVVDCPLVGKQCNIKTHNTIKGCFYLFLLYFL